VRPGGPGRRATPEDGTIAVSDAKRKIYAKRLIQISALLLLILSIVAVYLGAANLWRWGWWSSHYDGEYTQGDDSFWSESNVLGYLVYGAFFTVTGILGLIAFGLLWLKALRAVGENDKPKLRKLLLPIAIIAFIPSPGLIFIGFMLLFVFLMYRDERYDFFGLLLEDVTRTRRRGPPMRAEPTGYGDVRDAYAEGYVAQDLYSVDYASAHYGMGEGAYQAGGSLLTDTAPPEPEPEPEPAPAADEGAPPICASCGRPTEWIEEYGRYYCYDCDTYV
jgi:hypothetical protein